MELLRFSKDRQIMNAVTYLIGALVFGFFLFQIWHMIATKNWGKFDRTSALVWGSVGAFVLIIFATLFLIVRSGSNY